MQRLAAAGIVLALSVAAPARAQVTIDVAKITCNQFLLFQVADPQHIAIWFHGYYSGKRDNTVVDIQKLKADADRLRDWCRANINMTVMKGVETLFEPGK
jgi:hypothetical protein